MSDQIEPRNRAERRATARRTRKVAALSSGAVLALGAAGTATTLLTATPAAASTFEVTSLADDGGGSATTLREAIEQANTNAGQDTITFQTGLTGTITLTDDLPNITDALDIQGPGASVVTVDGADDFQIFNFYDISSSDGFNRVSGLTLTRGVPDNDENSGGAIHVEEGSAPFTLANSVLTDNHAPNDGGGANFYEVAGNVTITGSVITGNSAGEGGGGLYAFGDDDGLTLTISDSVISGNTAGHHGGGLYIYNFNTTITNTTISGNRTEGEEADGGGGLFARDDGSESTLTIRNSTVSGNTSQYYGGGLYIAITGPTTIENSTISGNTAKQAGGVYGAGGGLTLTQVTITNNSATDPDNGIAVGGIQVTGEDVEPGSVSDRRGGSNKSESDNHGGGPSAAAAGEGEVELVGTIIAGNVGEDIGVYNTVLTADSNHSVLGTIGEGVTVTDQGGTRQGVTDPGLAALTNNGGPTQTHALLPGSPAINTGPVPVPTFPGNAFDQRGSGFDRVVDGVVDVGAYEVQAPPVPESVVVTPKFTG